MVQKAKLRQAAPAPGRTQTKTLQGAKTAAAAALTFGAGAVASVSEILGFPSYAGTAAAALAGPLGPWVFAGSLAGYLFGRGLEAGIVQLCSILVVCALRAVDPFGERRDDPLYMGLTVTGVLMLFSAVMSAATSSDVYGVSMRMLSSLLCGGLTFGARIVIRDLHRTGELRVTGIEGVLTAMLYMALVGTLGAVRIGSVVPARAAAVFLTLCAARRYRSIGAAAIGALTAAGLMLCYPALGTGTLLLSAAGLICGAFAPMGTLPVTVSFLISLTVSAAASGQLRGDFPVVADGIIGAVAFSAVPASYISRLSRRLRANSSAAALAQVHSARLRMAGDALADIRHSLEQVTETLDRSNAQASPEQYVERCVCADCPAFDLCSRGDRLHRGLSGLGRLLRERGALAPEEVFAAVPSCTRPALLCDAFAEFSGRIEQDREENLQMRRLRQVLTGQLSLMEQVLDDLSDRAAAQAPDSAMSEALRELMMKDGARCVRAAVTCGADRRLSAEVYLTGPLPIPKETVAGQVSDLLACDMSSPDLTEEGGVTRLSFSELPGSWAETAVFSASAGGAPSGDSSARFSVGGRYSFVVLSDGMGTGKRAGIDSGFAVGLCKRLLSAGLSLTTTHGLVNSIMRVKGWEESFATLDMLRIDLSESRALLLKSGAATSRLVRDGSFRSIGGTAFPVGILESCEPDLTELRLFDGDLLLMMSDGVDEDTADELSKLAAARPDSEPEELVRELGAAVMDRSGGRRRDDVTLIAVRITGPRPPAL